MQRQNFKEEHDLLVTMNRDDLRELISETLDERERAAADSNINDSRPRERHLVKGIQAFADYLGVSRVTAQKIKSSGIIDKAVMQYGRTVVIDVNLALELLSVQPRRNRRSKIRFSYRWFVYDFINILIFNKL